jgi:alkanesulfonate monooxygenase SsuD/methylene tetrahydromethanopterin reductase-like flavin-dependent oxidoreductase (luciferase family)
LSTFDESIAAGFAKAGNGKSMDDFEIIPMINIAVSDDVEGCRNFFRPVIALYVGGMGARNKNFYNALVTRLGWADAAIEIQNLYLDGKKKEATAAVPDDLVDAICLVGPKERIADRVAAWKESKASCLMLTGANREALEVMAELCL